MYEEEPKRLSLSPPIQAPPKRSSYCSSVTTGDSYTSCASQQETSEEEGAGGELHGGSLASLRGSLVSLLQEAESLRREETSHTSVAGGLGHGH